MLRLLIVMLAGLLLAFAPARDLDKVVSALNSGNAEALSGHLADKVELNLPDKKGTLTPEQTVAALKAFFAESGVRSFEVKHRGDNGGNQFCIGTLHVRTGTFRTQVLLYNSGGRQLVRLISFQAP